jgi:hypothetical protein
MKRAMALANVPLIRSLDRRQQRRLRRAPPPPAAQSRSAVGVMVLLRESLLHLDWTTRLWTQCCCAAWWEENEWLARCFEAAAVPVVWRRL